MSASMVQSVAAIISRVVRVGILLTLTACTNDIIPPGHLEEPVSVYLADHGRHATLVLPDGRGGLVRYAYGDWRWYALSDEGLWQAVRLFLWPTQAGLGRSPTWRSLDAARDRAKIAEDAEEVIAIAVDASKVRALRHELEGIFRSNAATMVYAPRYDLQFVHHPDSYWLLRNSNTMLATWLEEMGCEVRGARLLSNWRLLEASKEPFQGVR